MVKRKVKKNVCNNDVPNWVVLVLLVAVIVVSTVSIILFMDAAKNAEPEYISASQGTISLDIMDHEEVNAGDEPENTEVAVTEGEVTISIIEEPSEE